MDAETSDRTTVIDDLPKTSAFDIAPSAAGARSPAVAPGLVPARYLLAEDGEAFVLEEAVTHVGRGMTADVRLDDHTVSSRHAIIVVRVTGLWILDDRSTNGTIVNGRRVDEAEL